MDRWQVLSSLAGRWDAASAAHYAELVLCLLPPRPLFPVPTFLCLSGRWSVLGVLFVAGGALTSPAEWELQGTSGMKAVLGAKREISLFCGLGWEERWAGSFYATGEISESSSARCNLTLQNLLLKTSHLLSQRANAFLHELKSLLA